MSFLSLPPAAHPAPPGATAAIMSTLTFLSLLTALPGEALAACDANDFSPTCQSMTFTASVGSVGDPLALLGPIGATISGTITMETDIDDTIGGDSVGFYPDAIECVSVDFDEKRFVVDIDIQTPEEVGIEVMNDIPSPSPPFTFFSDSFTAEIVGFADVDEIASGQGGLAGVGGFAYGYGEGCVDALPGCPPSILVDDGIPDAPGDLSVAPRAGTMTLDFFTLVGGAATVSGTLLDVTAADPIPCPEPGLASGLVAGIVGLAGAQRPRRA